MERDICADIYSLIFEVEAEVESIKNKLKETSKILRSFPASEDREGARKYSWSDVESFQRQILSSIEKSASQKSKIGEFAGKFEKVMQRRGILLGETPLPRVVSDAVVKAAMQPVGKSKPRSVPGLSISDISVKLEVKDNDELKQVAIDAAKKTGASAIKAFLGFTGASVQSLDTDEFADSKKASTLALNALQEIGTGITGSFKAISLGWEDTISSLPDGAASDNYFGRVSEGIKKTLTSPELRTSVSTVVEGTKKATQEIVTATKIYTGALGSKLSDSTAFNQAYSETVESFKVLAVSFTLLGSRYLQEITSQDRLLPPGR